MTNPFKTVSISLIPNFTAEDVWSCFLALLLPWRYQSEKFEQILTKRLKDYLGVDHVYLTESGRSAEYLLLKAMGVGPGDNVAIQAFTCVAVADAIVWTGAKPIYIEVDDSLNLDPTNLNNKIDRDTKAVIVQHTFGKPTNLDEIKKICVRKKLWLIEDAAHGLGNSYNGRRLGSIGDASFFSFGRDKVISGVWGGAIATSNQRLATRITAEVNSCPRRNSFWVAKQLGYVLVASLIINTYALFYFGKFIHKALNLLGWWPTVLTSEEKNALKPQKIYQGIPGPLAGLIDHQLRGINKIITHRQTIAKFYADELKTEYDSKETYLRYSIFVDNPASLREFAAKRNMFLGDWYNNVVAPKGVNLNAVSYQEGSCPNAENATRSIVNLPTNPNISLEDAEKVVTAVKQWRLGR